MPGTPKGLRTHIALFGRRNAGKSSLINALAKQNVSIVSNQPGTTTDPVEKTIELPEIGPAVLLDTAGLDDVGELGQLRANRSRAILERADMAIIVAEKDNWDETETLALKDLDKAHIPVLIVRNKMENQQADQNKLKNWRKINHIPDNIPVLDISALYKSGLDDLEATLKRLHAAREEPSPPMLHDLLPANGLVVLVAPIDTGAPKGRLILPQVMALRDCLDGGKTAVLVTEAQFPGVWQKLATTPDLVVCDSQVVKLVAEHTPPAVPMTTFSILMARMKGDLTGLASGASALKALKPADTVCIQEACSHHPLEDDIGRVKIPAMLTRMAGGKLKFVFLQGKETERPPRDTKAIVHCGGCVITRKQMLSRQELAKERNFPITNYGMAISLAQGVLERTLSPFPEALAAFRHPEK